MSYIVLIFVTGRAHNESLQCRETIHLEISYIDVSMMGAIE